MTKSSWHYNHGYGRLPSKDTAIGYFGVFLIGLAFGIAFYYTKTSEDRIAATFKRKHTVIIGRPTGFIVCDGIECHETR